MIEALQDAMRTAAADLSRRPFTTARIFHHNDADGLSSAAILTQALTRKGYRVERTCLEKPYPQVLRRIFKESGQLLIFADFAGRIVPLMADLNQGRNLVLILDHHAAQPFAAPRLHHLNPELFGIKGDRDISASTTCLMFARELDPANADLAHLAVFGAVGDRFHDDGRLTGENHRAMLCAADQGTIVAESDGLQEAYRFIGSDPGHPVHSVVTMLDTLGAAGYYQDGPELAVGCLINGFSKPAVERFQSLEAQKTAAFDELIMVLRAGGLRQTTHFQWFQVGRRFAPMGVKMIGVFCQHIRKLDFVDPNKYIVGFQRLADEIPGFGAIRFNADKISMRVPPPLAVRVRNGEQPGLDAFFPQATDRLGGFSDGCHSLAAATTLARGNEEALIEEMEVILSIR